MSSTLGEDAGAAYHGFWRRARLVGRISASFDSLTLSMSAAYFTALCTHAPEAWTTLVERTALLLEHARMLPPVVALDAGEREALEFFATIVRENADLIGRRDLAGLGAEREVAGRAAHRPERETRAARRSTPGERSRAARR